MVDVVASQTLYDGPNEIVIKLTNISDGVGESAIYIAGVGVRPSHGWRPWQPARARQTSKEAPWPRV